jgi:uncharacterized protein (DUF983 family)
MGRQDKYEIRSISEYCPDCQDGPIYGVFVLGAETCTRAFCDDCGYSEGRLNENDKVNA